MLPWKTPIFVLIFYYWYYFLSIEYFIALIFFASKHWQANETRTWVKVPVPWFEITLIRLYFDVNTNCVCFCFSIILVWFFLYNMQHSNSFEESVVSSCNKLCVHFSVPCRAKVTITELWVYLKHFNWFQLTELTILAILYGKLMHSSQRSNFRTFWLTIHYVYG